MALIKTSALISDIVGRVNGSVFQRTLGGLTLRTEPGHIRRQTTPQLFIRTAMKALQNEWRNLAPADASAWVSYAVQRNKAQHKNNLKTVSAQSLFIAENMLRQVMNLSVAGLTPLVITSPVIAPPAEQITIVSLKTDGTDFILTADRGINSGNSYLSVKMTRPLLNSQASQYNKFLIIPFTQSTSDNWNLNSFYITAFGRLPNIGEFINSEIIFGVKTENGISIPVRQRIEVESI